MGTNILRCNIEVWEERLIIYISLRCFTQHLLLLEDSKRSFELRKINV